MMHGRALAAKRAELGLTVEQAAAGTRIHPKYIRALEADELDRIPAPVFARGYLRTYATYLELEPDPLVRNVQDSGHGLKLSIAPPESPQHKPWLTTHAIAAAGIVLLISAFAGYAGRQIVINERTGPAQMTAVASTSPALIQPKPIVVGVRVTDAVWINAIVDGNPQYGDLGRTLPAGSVVNFTGTDVKVTSSKASATFISVDGRNLGVMGLGVVTREFSSQTSP